MTCNHKNPLGMWDYDIDEHNIRINEFVSVKCICKKCGADISELIGSEK